MRTFIKITAAFLIVNLPGALNAQTPDIIWETGTYLSSVRDISYADDGQTIATVSNAINLWSASDGSPLDSISFSSSGVLSVDISPDGQNIAAGYIVSGYPPGGLTDVWNLSSHALVNDFGGAYLAFSPDGNTIVTGGGAVLSSVIVSNVYSGATIFSEWHGSYISAVAYSPNGDVVASGGTNNKVRLWDAMTGTMLHELTGHTDNISSLAFSDDGTMLASSEGGFDVSGQSVIKTWYVANGTLLQTLEGHGNWVHDVNFSPDGQYLISSGRESTSPNLVQKIKIWQLSDGQLAQEYDASAYSVNYSPDGQSFAYGSPYGGLYLAQNPFAPASSNFDINLTYNSGSPVPANGGFLNFDVFLQNNDPNTVNFDLWVEIPPQVIPPAVPYRNLTFASGFSITRNGMQWYIPVGWPAGSYEMVWNIGNLSTLTVWAQDSFTFEKSAVADGSNSQALREVDSDPLDQLFGHTDLGEAMTVSEFALMGNYPNPFNPTTTIRFAIPDAAKVILSIYDVQGRQVTELVNGQREAGVHEVTFDAAGLASGVYFYRLNTRNYNAIGKMMLVK